LYILDNLHDKLVHFIWLVWF